VPEIDANAIILSGTGSYEFRRTWPSPAKPSSLACSW
jgi:hypothetical protein